MCGIAGFLSEGPGMSVEDSKNLLRKQIASIRYRGPDASGFHYENGVGLAHARLSIIDVSTSANQPMADQAGKAHVAFNGEIYNFQEIRVELERHGVSFRTKSDTEVLVEGYARWGLKILDRLRGMFAIAIYDKAKDELILVRDRVGKKPLYYAKFGDQVVFGSEIKAILCHPLATRDPDYQAIHEYLTFQYVPCPMTAFKGIYKVPPAHLVRVSRSGRIEVKRYFSLPTPSNIRSKDRGDLCSELVEILKEATRLRMISDVPLGAFLSGGVDSSAIVAMMAQVSDDPVRTFTIGFDENAYDEREYARMISKRYGTIHEEMIVKPNALEVLEKLVYHYGEPFADSSAIPTYYVSKIAREQVTVILSGDGGDESFLGYPRYLNCRLNEPAQSMQHNVLRKIAAWQEMLPSSSLGHSIVQRLRSRLRRQYGSRSRLYEQYIAYFSDESKVPLYSDGMSSFLGNSALDRLDPYLDAAPTYALGAAWADTHTYLPDDLMVKVDVASMANSLEVRAPFLDHELMTWAAQIPEHLRFENQETKSLLKKAMEPYLPHELMYRPKMGFGVPIDQWLRGDLRDFARDTLLSSAAKKRGLFNITEIESLLDRHDAGENWASRIWALLMLELWFQMWIDTSNPFSHPASLDTINKYPDSELLVA